MALADFEHGMLDGLGVSVGNEAFKFHVEVFERRAFQLGGGTALLGRLDKVAGVIDGQRDQ